MWQSQPVKDSNYGVVISSLYYFCHLFVSDRASLYGEGTYLSTDIGVAVNFAKSGACRPESGLGSNIMCLAVVEVVNHPSVKKQGDIADNPCTSALSGHVRIPEKCMLVLKVEFNPYLTAIFIITDMVVPNDDHLRLKYVFVYTSGGSSMDALSETNR